MDRKYTDKKYDLMLANIKIGTFRETYSPARKICIELEPEVLNKMDDVRMSVIRTLQQNGEIDDTNTRKWISSRVFPKTRQNANEILSNLGLSEYDQIEIFKKNHGCSTNDHFWIRENKNETFEDVNPKGEKILNSHIWNYEQGFVLKSI